MSNDLGILCLANYLLIPVNIFRNGFAFTLPVLNEPAFYFLYLYKRNVYTVSWGSSGWWNTISQLKIIGLEPMIYRRSWPIEAMMGVR